jgi:hypothetical protein
MIPKIWHEEILFGSVAPGAACQNGNSMQKRFYRAMVAYAVLALMAGFTLDGKFRLAVWIFLGGLALKTCIAYKASTL